MANTTFKGPVRSQNGFQELVGGVWTPVGGGGGSAIIIPRPTDADVSIELAAPTDIGQVYKYALGPKPAGAGSYYVYISTPNPLTALTSFVGGVLVYDTYGAGTISVYNFGGGSPSPELEFSVSNNTISLNLEIVYVGEDSNGYQIYSVAGQFVYYGAP